MSNFTLAEWREANKDNFDVPEDVRTTITELRTALYKVCHENEVPFFCLTVGSASDEQGYEVDSSVNVPINRTPAELLAITAVADQGILSGMSVINELFNAR